MTRAKERPVGSKLGDGWGVCDLVVAQQLNDEASLIEQLNGTEQEE